eukprot:Gb_27104 [translate_table: standard]
MAMSIAYHPQTDGQTKVVNKCLERYLRMCTGDKQKLWVKWLPLAEWWYNTTYHTATRMTPFQALNGYEPPHIVSYLHEIPKVQALTDQVQKMQEILQLLKDNLQMARNRMKQQADQKRSEREFAVGDWVYLRLQPYKHASIKRGGKHKLSPKFYGPYKILRRVGEVAYVLELPKSSKIHNTFHVSSLKRVVGQKVTVQTELPELDEEGKLGYHPKMLPGKEKKSFNSIQIL